MDNNPSNTYNLQENTLQNPNPSLEKKGFFTKTKIFLLIITLLVIGGLLFAQYYNQVFFSSKKPEQSLEKVKTTPDETMPTPVILSTSPLIFNHNNYEIELLQNATFQNLEGLDTKNIILNTSKTHPLDSDTNTLLDANSEFLNFELIDPNDLPNDQDKYEIVNYRAADSNLWTSDKIVQLPNPFETKIYRYNTMGSTTHFIIDLYKNNQRQELYTAVNMYAFSEDGRKLFIQNSARTGEKRQLKTRVINIEKNTEVSLPNLFCIGGTPKWQGNRVIVGRADDGLDREFNSDICIFDDNGNLVARISANLATNVGIMVPYSLLPNDPDTFYTIGSRPAVSGSWEDSDPYFCSLYLLNVVDANVPPKFVNLVNLRNVGHPYGCAEFSNLLNSDDLKLENLKLSSGNMEIRLKNNEESVKTNSDIRTPWIKIDNNNLSQ